MARIVSFGNEKGGSGKSTTAMHIFAAAAHSGYKVGVIDLDLRQQSFFHYLDNRERTAEHSRVDLPMPLRYSLSEGGFDSARSNKTEEEMQFTEALQTLDGQCDLILIDCPGNNTNYSQMAHSVADTLITPMNDSFVDFDLLAAVDPITDKITGPSVYAEMVWEARNLRHKAGLPAIDWIVVRNRIATTETRNRKRISEKLTEFSKRIGFRVTTGFSERIVFREMFTQGITLLDLPMMGKEMLNVSSITARQEVRDLIKEINLKGFEFNI